MRISDWSSDVCSSDLAKALTFTGRVAIDLDLFEASTVITMNALDLSFTGASLAKADGSGQVPLTATVDAAAQTVTFTAPHTLAPGQYKLTTDYKGVINKIGKQSGRERVGQSV